MSRWTALVLVLTMLCGCVCPALAESTATTEPLLSAVEENSTEENSTENTSAEETDEDKDAAEQTAAGDGAASDSTAATENTSSGQNAAEGAGTEGDSAGETNAEDTSTDKTDSEESDTTVEPPAEAVPPVVMTAADVTLGVKQTATLSLANVPEGAALKYATSNKKICKVNSKGVVTAVAKGTAKITVTASTGETATCTVTVVAAPNKVTISAKKATLAVGNQLQLSYAIPANTIGTVTWSSSKSKVAKVDSNGLVTAVGAGTATITVKTHNGKKATCKVTVKKAPTWVKAQFDEATLGVGQKVEDMFSITKNTLTQMSYACTIEGVVEMDGNTLKAVGLGETELTATTHNGHSVTVKVKVLPAPDEMTIPAESMTLAVKQTADLRATLPEGTMAGITYTSSKPKVVKVSAEGKLTALKAGTSVITVSTHNGLKKQCTVTVKKAPSKITLKDTSLVMYVGQQYQEKYTITKNSTTTLNWSVNNSDVLEVNQNGMLTAKAVGSATVKVKTHNGKKDTLKVLVYKAPTYLTLEQDSATLGVKMTLQLKPDTDTTYAKALTYTSSNVKVAKVSTTGLIKAVGAGTATITVKSQNGLEDSITLTVYAAPKKVTLPKTSITIGVGETYTVEPKLTANSYTKLTYAASNKYVTVTQDGVVTGVKPGTSKVKVKTHNGKSATLTVKVAKQPGSITLAQDSLTLDEGATAKLSYTLPSGTLSAVRWSSSNTSVCTVDDSGTVTCVGNGTATITVTTTNGKKDACVIQVVEPAASLKVDSSFSMFVGDTATLNVEALTASGDAYKGVVSITSDDTTIAKIISGNVYGKAAGTCNIQVKASGQTATVQVTVNSVANDSRRDTIVSAAMEKLGCKYVYGNSGPNAFDCAGLVYYAYKQVGIKIKYSAYAQGYSVGNRIEEDDLLPGDIVCFDTNENDTDASDHTGIYIGGGKFVHSSSVAAKVIVSDLTSGYYQRVFSWGVRVLTSSN